MHKTGVANITIEKKLIGPNLNVVRSIMSINL